ncbi:MAG: hypothetical protein B7Z80_19310 [Rhodospirillales bacterium 20-64-7]|nr:MAG: hypothetical protein B7Z80_19310 [Rhodospirillales bacterium 20-64-7]
MSRRDINAIADELRPVLRANIADLAEALLGAPNPLTRNKREWRWGRKGSFRVFVAGPKQGAWTDFEAGASGDPIKLIMHQRACDFAHAVLWGAAWAGIATDGQHASPGNYAALAARDAIRKTEQARKQVEAEADEAMRIAHARSLAKASVPLAGTIAERYLTETRGIQRPSDGWPDAVRYHRQSQSLLLIGTDRNGEVRFVQRVYLTADARKISPEEAEARNLPAPKATNGVMDGAYVRLPGLADGPLMLAEGPETGLSVWTATGAETWLSTGGIIRHEPPPGRRVVICRDDDKPESPSDRALSRTLRSWRATGVDIVVATPWAGQRGDKTDFNDTMKAGGAEAVRARIDAALLTGFKAAPAGPHYRRPHLSGEAASRRLEWVISAMFNRLEKYLEARAWLAEEADRIKPEVQERLEAKITAKLIRQGVDADTAAEQAAERAAKAAAGQVKVIAKKAAIERFGGRAVKAKMPRIQIKGAAGLGKTRAIIREYVRRPAMWRSNIVFYAKTLQLMDDFADGIANAQTVRELEALTAGVPATGDGARPNVRVIRGRSAEGMCHSERIEVVEAAAAAGVVSVHRACCHAPARDGVPASSCPFFNWCKDKAYMAQFDNQPALRIMPHARLTLNQPDDLNLPAPDLVIVDETVVSEMVTHGEAAPAAMPNSATFAAKPGEEDRIQEAMDMGKAVVMALADGNVDAVERLRAGGVATPELLRAAAAMAAEAADLALPALWPSMLPKEAKQRCAARKAHPGRAVASIFRQLARDLEANRRTSTGVEWTTRDGNPVILVHGVKPAIGAPADAALVLLDADADLEINRRLFGVNLRGFTISAARRAHVIQISDAALGVSTLTVKQADGDDAAKLRAWIAGLVQREVASGTRKVLVFCAKKVRLALTGEIADGNLPAATQWCGAALSHFGRHLGANDWADFDTVVIVGRLEPPVEVVEQQARAIYADADDVTLDLRGEYVTDLRRHDLRHGLGPAVKVRVHPDPRVQALVEIWRENAMGQAIDRLRLIHRGADQPARVVVLSNLPVPGLVVDELLTKKDALAGGTVWQRALLRAPGGVLPLSVAWLVANLPDLFPSEATAKRALKTLKGSNANMIFYWQMSLLRISGQKRHSKALVRPDLTAFEARTEAALLLGAEVVEFRGLEAEPAAPPPTPAPAPAEPPAITEPVLPVILPVPLISVLPWPLEGESPDWPVSPLPRPVGAGYADGVRLLQ